MTRKVWVFANDGAARPLSTLEAAILGEFDGRPVDLIEAAGAAWHALASAASPSTPSRGPVPSTCGPSVRNVQGPAAVYVAELLGASFANGRILAKVGRSGDPQRREVELNFALPPPLGLRWAIVAAWWFEDAAAAHRIEQDILRTEGEAGRSAGGEFLYLDEAGIHQLVDQCRRPCARLGDGAEAGRRQFAPASEGAGASLLYQDERLPRPR